MRLLLTKPDFIVQMGTVIIYYGQNISTRPIFCLDMIVYVIIHDGN